MEKGSSGSRVLGYVEVIAEMTAFRGIGLVCCFSIYSFYMPVVVEHTSKDLTWKELTGEFTILLNRTVSYTKHS